MTAAGDPSMNRRIAVDALPVAEVLDERTVVVAARPFGVGRQCGEVRLDGVGGEGHHLG